MRRSLKLLYLHSTRITSQMANLNQVVQMCNAFAANGEDVTLSLAGDKLPGKVVVEKLQEIYGEIRFNVLVRSTIISQMTDNYLLAGSIKRAITQIKPDLIFCRNHLYLKPCINSGIPTMFESHDANLHLRLKWLDTYYKKYIKKVSWSSKSFLMITISEALKRFWMNIGVPEEKVIALHDGFNPDMFEPALSREESRKHLGLDQERIIATYTGNLFPNREVDVILHLAEDFPGVLFLVVGGPDENKDHLEQMARQRMLSNIMFTGRVPHKNIPTYLFAADILLGLWSSKVRTIDYCSPLKVFEYMAAGRLIVAHGFPTIREVLRHNENALIFEPGNRSDLINTFKTAMQLKDQNTIAMKARKDVHEKYAWNNRARSILEHIIKLYSTPD